MSFLVSPGVQVREIDLTTIVPSVSTTEGAIAGVFRWGPINETVLIDSETELVKRFGRPTNLNPETFFTAASFLAYGNKLYVSRAANTTGVSPTIVANVQVSNATVTLVTGNTVDLFAGLIVVGSANGGLAVGATIAAISNLTAFTITSNAHAIATATNDTVLLTSNTVFSAVANTGAVSNLEYCIIRNENDLTTKLGTIDTDVPFIARFPGEPGNSLKISVCGNSIGHFSTIDLSTYGTRARMLVPSGSNTANVQVCSTTNALASGNSSVLKGLLNLTDLVEVGNSTVGQQFLKIVSIGNTFNYGTSSANLFLVTSATNTTVLVVNSTSISDFATSNTGSLVAGMLVTHGNNHLLDLQVASITNTTAFVVTTAPAVSFAVGTQMTISPTTTFALNLEDKFTLAESFEFNSSVTARKGINRYWEYYNLVDVAPGQSDHQIAFGNSSINSDEIHIVVADEGGVFTGIPGTVLEVYRAVSRATDSKTLDGTTNHWKTVINDASQYVYAVNDISGAASNTALLLTSSTLDNQYMRMAYGKDGADESNIALGVLSTAWDRFKSKEDIEVSLLLQGKARGFTLANYLIDNIAEPRMDCIVLASPQKGDVVNNIGNEAIACVQFRDNLRSSSYGVLDSGYKYMYDRYNDLYRWIPLNGDTAGLCVRTDSTNDAWWSPAGFNRGHIKNSVKLAWNPRQADRDTLYKKGINPVVTFPGQGTVLFGDKTLLAKPSAFDRINVRRLFIVLEKAISKAAEFTLFEFNDQFTRAQFKNLVVPYLREVKGRRGIHDFLVVCDETNNTSDVIDRNAFVGDIYIKPARSINEIQLNFVAVPTGIAFSEIVGKF